MNEEKDKWTQKDQSSKPHHVVSKQNPDAICEVGKGR